MIVEQYLLIYLLNEEDKTAKIIDINNTIGSIYIPRSVTYQQKEYKIIDISEKAFELTEDIFMIQFASDSELQTIEQLSFCRSSINCLILPSNFVELKDCWCMKTPELNNVILSQNNVRYKSLDNGIIVGKINLSDEQYEELVFVNRNIKQVTIPEYIKIIGSYSFSESLITSITIPDNVQEIKTGAFSECANLKQIKFSPNSQLRIIGQYAFSETSIKKFTLPSHVKQICENAFYLSYLRQIEIPINSELISIESSAFAGTYIKNLFLPSNTCKLEDGWCKEATNLNSVKLLPNNNNYIYFNEQMVLGKIDKNSNEYNIILFANRCLKNVTIPSFIKIIGSYTFSESRIRKIIIPSNVEVICQGAFKLCHKLKILEIESNSRLKTIEKEAFSNTSIENLVLPSSVVELKDGWCIRTSEINSVIINQNNPRYKSLDNGIIVGKINISDEQYGELIFVNRNINKVIIPEYIKIIGSYSFSQTLITNITIPDNVQEIKTAAFSECKKLEKVVISPNSKLQLIDDDSFNNSLIHEVFIPTHVKRIGLNAFINCQNLKKVVIPSNSDLQRIEEYSFYCTKIQCLFIPSKISYIHKFAFSKCINILIIEFDENSEIQINSILFYNYIGDTIFMLPVQISKRFSTR